MRIKLLASLLISSATFAAPPVWDAGRAFGQIFGALFPQVITARHKPAVGGGGTGAVTQVGTGNVVGTDVVVTLSPTPTTGHALVVSAAVYNCTAVTITVTDGTNTYTKATTDEQNATHSCTQLWTVPNISVSGSITVTLHSSGADYLRMHVYDVDTSVTPSLVDSVGTPTNTDASTSSGTVGITTSSANTVIFGNFSGITDLAATPGTGWTLGYDDHTVTTVPLTLTDVYKIVTSSGAYTPNLTWPVPQASGYVAQAVAVKY